MFYYLNCKKIGIIFKVKKDSFALIHARLSKRYAKTTYYIDVKPR